MAALRDALKRRGYDTEVSEYLFVNRVKFHIQNLPKVSIIIPSDDRKLLLRCVTSILRHTDYAYYEIITIAEPELDPEAMPVITAEHPIRNYGLEWADNNLSVLTSRAVKNAIGQYLVFMSDRIEAIQPDWLTEMVCILERKEVAACAPKLCYEDGAIHYAGILASPPYWKNLTFQGFNEDTQAYFWLAQYPRNVTVLTDSCLLIKKDAFDQVGGFDSGIAAREFAVKDLSLRLVDHGYELVYMPYAELRIH